MANFEDRPTMDIDFLTKNFSKDYKDDSRNCKYK